MLKEFKPKSVEKVVDKDIDGEHETYQSLGASYTMYMEHIVYMNVSESFQIR